MTQYTLTIPELLMRPIIRNDQVHEYLNKMTDDELIQRDQEIYAILEEDGVKKVFPDWNSAYMSKQIDSHILYEIFQKGDTNIKYHK
jgi:hypothetical protein